MAYQITYTLFPDGLGFYADCQGRHIGQITFVRVGIDKLVIDATNVSEDFRRAHVGLDLVRHVADFARQNHRKVMAMCPFAKAMFSKYPEFDDVRFMHIG